MIKKFLLLALIASAFSLQSQIDLINENIGIGTLNPSFPIHLKGDTYKFQNEAGVDLFHMNINGNIGIGKAPTTHKLDVNGNISAHGRSLYLGNGQFYFDNNSAFYTRARHSSIVQLIMKDKENTIYGRLYGSGNGANFGLLDQDGHWSFLAAKDNYTQIRINNDEKLHIDNGSVSLKPQQLELGWNHTGDRTSFIDFRSDDTYTDYSFRMIRHGGANAPSQIVHRGTGSLDVKTQDAGDMHFLTQDIHRMTIKGANPGGPFGSIVIGHVGIGTTNPSQKLHVNGSIQYTGSLINASDKRLKKNINKFKYGVAEVLKLNPVTYQYKEQVSDLSEQVSVGLLAQELQKVAPELVKTFQEPTRELLDEQGEKSLDEFLAIEESAIKYMLINAIKEQQAQLDEQGELIEALRSEISEKGDVYNLENSIQIALENSEDNLTPFLAQNIPNPTQDNTVIKYFIPEGTQSAIIRFYNLNGQVLKEVQLSESGQGAVDLDLDRMISGSYMYTLIVDDKLIETKTMIIAR